MKQSANYGMAVTANGSLQTAFYRTGERSFRGYAFDTGNPNHKPVVEIIVDGYPLKSIRADGYAPDLGENQVAGAYHGFACVLPEAVITDAEIIEARLANLDTIVGAPIRLSMPSDPTQQNASEGTVHWLGGLRFSGCFCDSEAAIGNVFVDGSLVSRVRPSRWSHFGKLETDARAVKAFDFWLPRKYADGNAHQLVVRNDRGEDISGKPIVFIAYADGLRELVASTGLSGQERLRAQLFDEFLPMSVPFSAYQDWRERFPILIGPTVPLSCGVLMVGGGAAEETLASLKEQIHHEWVAAALPETRNPFAFKSELALEFLRNDGSCDFVVFMLSGTVLAPTALQRLASAFAEYPEAQLVYGDVDFLSDDGSIWPLAFPVFDYERMLEQGYCACLFAVRRVAAERSIAAGASNLYRIFNSTLDDGTISRANIVHLPGALGTLPRFDKYAAGCVLTVATGEHLRHKGVQATVTLRHGGVLPAVQVSRKRNAASVTVIIPTRNRYDLLRNCIESIRPAVERIQAEILIVDNDSADSAALECFAEINKRAAKVIRVPGEFNFAKLNNCAATAANGEILCFLDDDVKALNDQWLDEMLSRIADREVGAVGGLLIYPSKIVQHGGIVLGPSFAAADAFNDRLDGDVGYCDLLRVAHECSAVTAACLATRRDYFFAVGGMDEVRFPIHFSDVDYCLKLRAGGKRIVFTPHARLLHLESAGRRRNGKAGHKEQFERELQDLRAKWGAVLAADPYYSPILSREPIPFSALAWPPGRIEPRANKRPVAIEVPAGF